MFRRILRAAVPRCMHFSSPLDRWLQARRHGLIASRAIETTARSGRALQQLPQVRNDLLGRLSMPHEQAQPPLGVELSLIHI